MLRVPEKVSLNGNMTEGNKMERKNTQTIEERSFNTALIMIEGHFESKAGFGHKTMGNVKKTVGATLDASLNKADVRYVRSVQSISLRSQDPNLISCVHRENLAKNVDIWQRLRKIFDLAIPVLNSHSLRESFTESGQPASLDVPESATLILKNYEVIVQDLHYLNNLLVISRNMLAIKETAQEICHAVGFDRSVNRLVVLCVNVTSKGYDGENVDEGSRGKLNEVTEVCEYNLT